MNPYLLNIVLMITIPLIILIIGYILFKDQIMSFINPNGYCIIEMIERDSNISSWLQKKDKDLQFSFNDGLYNMFEMVTEANETNKQFPPLSSHKVFSNIYRKGRLSKLFYKEGERNPIDIRNMKIVSDAQQANQLDKIQLSRMIHSGYSIANELWNKFGFWIVCGILLIVLYIATKEPKCVIEAADKVIPTISG